MPSFKSPDFFENAFLFRASLGLFVAAGIALIIFANGTCDGGDSVMHYQFARYAPLHPELFFHHWAKPLYVLMASPFCQFGLPGVKIFNILLSALTIFFTWKIAGVFQIKRSALVGLFMAFTPALLIYSLSGLTEPLFAFVLVLCIWLYLKDKTTLCVLLLSFLPFIRSEGLIIIGVFSVLLALEKRFWLLPLFCTGHVVYGLAGVVFHVHNSVFWVIRSIPYARLDSEYGKGTWGHFFIHLPEFIGLPLFTLLMAGIVAGIVNTSKLLKNRQGVRELVLIYGCFLAYFFAHVTFWALGMFNSFGMMRVMIGVLPLMALIELRGLNILDMLNRKTISNFTATAICVLVIAYPFTRATGAWNYKRDFCLDPGGETLEMAAKYIRSNYKDYKTHQYYFDSNYASVALGLDFFDTTKSMRTWQAWDKAKTKGFVLWDKWYSGFEYKIPIEALQGNPRLRFVKEFEVTDNWGSPVRLELFETKN